MHSNEALFANEAFYLAFAEGDMEAMDALWSQREQLVCIHPGWAALTGREAVLESWRSILGNADQPKVSFYGAQALAMDTGSSTVAVVCYEVLPGSVLVAMNLFVEESGQPRLVHHQSGPCASPPPLEGGAAILDG